MLFYKLLVYSSNHPVIWTICNSR